MEAKTREVHSLPAAKVWTRVNTHAHIYVYRICALLFIYVFLFESSTRNSNDFKWGAEILSISSNRCNTKEGQGPLTLILCCGGLTVFGGFWSYIITRNKIIIIVGHSLRRATPGRGLPYGSGLGLSRCLGPGECLHSFTPKGTPLRYYYY